jgi:hypothetical protein
MDPMSPINPGNPASPLNPGFTDDSGTTVTHSSVNWGATTWVDWLLIGIVMVSLLLALAVAFRDHWIGEDIDAEQTAKSAAERSPLPAQPGTPPPSK